MLDDGASFSEVARTLHRHKGTICKHFPGRGWAPGSGAQYRRLKAQLDRLAGAL